jgi:hypothetical protein
MVKRKTKFEFRWNRIIRRIRPGEVCGAIIGYMFEPWISQSDYDTVTGLFTYTVYNRFSLRMDLLFFEFVIDFIPEVPRE